MTRVLITMHFPKIGDFILLIPVYQRLARRADLDLTIIVPDPVFELVRRHQLLPHIVRRRDVDPFAAWDRVIDASPIRPGPIPFPHEVLDAIHSQPPEHMTMAYARGLQRLFPDFDPDVSIAPYLDVDLESDFIDRWGLDPFSYYTIHSGSDFPPKNWPMANFRAFAEAMHETFPEIQCLEIVGPSDEPLYADGMRPDWCVMIEASLEDVAELLAGALFHVDNDSGIHHLAGALDVPTISVWGPTGPGSWASVTKRNFVHWGGTGLPSALPRHSSVRMLQSGLFDEC